jgi:hypothetical protein
VEEIHLSYEHLKTVLSSAGQHLGDLVFWSLSDAEIQRSALEALWASAGLSFELLPEPPTAEKALKVAVRECAVGHPEHLLRLGKEDATEVVFAVVHEKRQGDGSLIYDQEAKIQLDRVNEHVNSDNPSHELVAAVRSAFSRLRMTHTADDVRRAIVKALRSFSAVTLRDGGGIYWVPRPHADQLRQLQTAIEQVGSSAFYLLPVHESAEASRTLGEVAKSSVEEELAALKREIEGFVVNPPERASTLVRRLESFDVLRAKAALYRDILHVQVTDLDAQLASLTTSVEELLDGKIASHSGPAHVEVNLANASV